MTPDCPLCTAPSSHVEGPLADGGWLCNVCSKVFHVDADGKVVKIELTNQRPSPFRQAIKAINGSEV